MYIGSVRFRQVCPIPDEEVPMSTTVISNPHLNFQLFPCPASMDEIKRSGVWEFIDENELVDEMANSLPIEIPDTPASDIDPEDFEQSTLWFLS